MTSMGNEPDAASELRQQAAPVVVAIDDDTTFLLATAKALASAGMVCHTATTGEAGLRLIREDKPDIVLLDILLIGESGFTICQEIRCSWSPEELPVIMVTGLEDLESIKAAYESGANDYLVKPLHWELLPFRISHILQASRDITERKRTEEELEKSKDLLQKVLDNLPIPVYFKNQDERYSLTNRTFQKFMGLTNEDLLGKTSFDISSPLLGERYRQSDRLLLETREPIQYETLVQAASGLRQVVVTKNVMLNPSGELIGLVGAFLDITDRKQAEEERRISEEKFNKIFFLCPDLITINRLEDGVYLDVNNNFMKILGYDREEVIGRSSLPSDLGIWVDKSDRERLMAKIHTHGEAIGFETQLKRKDGTVITALESCRRLEINGEPCLLSVTRDITERKRVEDKLRESEERYRAQFNLASEGIIAASAEGGLLEVNEAFARMHGYAVTEMQHMSLEELNTPASQKEAAERARRVLAGETLTFELEHFHKDGHAFPMEVSAGLVYAGGKPIRLSFHRDITERKKAETKLREIEELFQSLLETTQDGFWVTDLQGRLLQVNEAYCRMSGYDRPELLAMSIADFEAEETSPEQENHIRAIMVKGADRFETRHRRKDGSTYDVEVTVQCKPERTKAMISFIRDITERKQAEKALRDSDERFGKIFQLSPDAIDLTRNHDGVSLDLNKSYTKLYGYTREEFIGHSTLPGDLGCWANKEDRERYLALLKKHGEVREFEAHAQRKDGSIFMAQLTSSVIEIDGEPCNLCITRDITERKQAEMALRETNELLALFFHHSPIYAYIKEVTPTESRILQASDNFEQMIGVKASEMVGKRSADMFPADFAAKTLADDLAVIAGGKTLEVEEELNGRSYTTLKFPIVQGGKTLLAGFTIDITEPKKTKEALTAQSTALAAVIDNNPMSIQILDSKGRTIRTNPAFFALFGAIPPPDYSMFSDPTLAAQGLSPVFDQIRAGEVVYFPETTYNVHDLFPEYPDMPVWIRALGFPIMGADGRPERYVLVHEDISQRRKTEEENVKLQAQLLQAQKMEGLGSLAGGIAHDMNNVLGAILGMASANIAAQPVGSPVYRAFDTISQAAVRGGKMVKSLLNFARQSPTEEHELDMNAILREEVDLLERTTLAKIRLEIDLASELRPILGDANALAHAFMNLCVNAVDAMPENGTLTLRTQNVDNDWTEVLVEDTGTGMPKEILEKAMDPFFTTKGVGKGTGLGLSMVYSTVKAHRGQIEIQSEPGQGTRVRMRFPA